mgnify:CR=1 FL=1
MVTRAMVRDWLLAYLNGEVEQAALVGWAREVKRGAAVFSRDAEVVNPALARIGLTGVGGYRLTWDDCFNLLEDLGYAPRVVAEPVDDLDDGSDEVDAEDEEEGVDT